MSDREGAMRIRLEETRGNYEKRIPSTRRRDGDGVEDGKLKIELSICLRTGGSTSVVGFSEPRPDVRTT
ncbi:Hypothetical protein NTJ_05413 [Nesidiocoris tenuis]|uniref:Uncharacterized protein n=1 Tax=Nesidiocoris tenuis TaxID=355587 RepID=A0ABN7AKV2_9HEMI|nr:Hypothetical protein NTJ_05413 [Nesidiocoris tenuis]